MQLYLLIALGGALGSVARFWLNGIISMHYGETSPWGALAMGTLVINITGSFAIGFFSTLTGPDGRWFASANSRAVSHDWRLRQPHDVLGV